MMRGDDYYVLEVSLLYTEFKKMEGHVVQAPNSILNTLFILNQRRSQGLADPINLKLRFGTTEAQIEELKARMLAFCLQNKRDYSPRIISEVQTIDEVYSVTMNIIFFHKSNYQNELLRLSRHNKFATELMHQMADMGLEGPRVVQPGGMRGMPMYWTQVQPPPAYQPANPSVSSPPPTTAASAMASPVASRRRGNSMAAVVETGMDFQDIYQNRRQDAQLQRLSSIDQSPNEHAEGATGLNEMLGRPQSRESASVRMRGWGRTGSRVGRNKEAGSMSNVV